MAKGMLLLQPVLQFFDNSGLVLNGGLLYFYEPGTTTPKNTYTTSAKSVANANPVVLDSAGRPDSSGTPIDIYLDGSYKLVVKTSTGTTIRTVDPINTLGQLINTRSITTNDSPTVSDRDKLILADASSGAITITLLAAATAGDGFNLKVKKIDSSANTITLDGNASETIDGATTFVIRGQNDFVSIISDGTSWYTDINGTFSGNVTIAGNLAVTGTTTLTGATSAGTVTSTLLNVDNLRLDVNTISSTDTNGNIILLPNGTGDVVIGGNSTGPATLRFLEDSDNGTNYVGFVAPASVTSDQEYTLPATVATANNQILISSTAGALSFAALTALAASQADQETGTSVLVPVVPGVQHFHQSAAKLWIRGTDSTTISRSYNVSSVTDTGTGDHTFNFSITFSDSAYAFFITGGAQAIGQNAGTAPATTSLRVQFKDAAGSLTDASLWNLAIFGDI